MTTKAIEESVPLAFQTASQMTDAEIVLASEVTGGEVTVAQVRVLKATICSKLSLPQLQLYLTICHRRGVDPFSGAYAFPQPDGGLAFGLRIDGMRALAMATGEYLSRTVETLFDGDGPEKKLMGARATIVRSGMSNPVVEEAWMGEYGGRGGQGWAQFPETMIRKVAESKALRAAFPDALAGWYEPAEMPPKEDTP